MILSLFYWKGAVLSHLSYYGYTYVFTQGLNPLPYSLFKVGLKLILFASAKAV